MGDCLVTALVVLFAGERPPAVWYPFVVCSVGWVRAEPDGVGTGWLVEGRQFITCRHVIGERKEVEVFFPGVSRNRADYLGQRDELRRTGLLVRGRVIRTDDRTDLAVIELASAPPGCRALTMTSSSPAPGELVWSIGHRHDLDTLWNVTVGPVRQTGRLSDGYFWRGTKLAVDVNALLLQLPIAEGDSGGPVFDTRGRVVGVVSAQRNRTPVATVGIATDAVRQLLNDPAPVGRTPDRPITLYSTLAPATVWVRPTATDSRTAGVLIDRERRLVLTTATGLGESNRLGVTFPLAGKPHQWLGEREGYTDPVTLHLKEAWRTGTIIARDERRDLALVKLDSLPPWAQAVSLARRDPAVGEPVHAISHPPGVEFAWVYSLGTVRQAGRVALGSSEQRSETLVLQLSASGKSSGGPVVNEQGALIGVLAAKTGAQQQVAYVATVAELRGFLADLPAAGLPSLDRTAILRQAEKYLMANQPKQAAGELARWLDVDPADTETRRRLGVAWAKALDDARAAKALADVLRIDAKELPRVTADIATHADALHEKNPAAAESWLRTAIPALATALPPGADRDRLMNLPSATYASLRAALQKDARIP